MYVYWLLFILGYFVAIMKNGRKLIWRRDGAEETHDTLLNILNNRIKLLDKPEEEKRKLAKYLENYYKLEKNEKK